MPAYVEHAFERGFLLDEARLRKIRDCLDARLSKRPTCVVPTYKVYRGDAYSYTTAAVDDVVREDNEDWRRITRLDVLVEEKDKLELRLTFSRDGVQLNIAGDDRDEVFLLFSDLRDYIQNEVAVARALTRQGSRLLAIVVMLAAMLPLFSSIAFHAVTDSAQSYQDALAANDVHTKLDFLITAERRRSIGRWAVISLGMMLIAMMLILTDVPERLMRQVFLGNQFLFGKQQQVFERRHQFLANVVWGIGVAFVVSLVAGLLVWFVTMRKLP